MILPRAQDDELVFREPRSRAELRELLRLRYEIYRSCRMRFCCPENTLGLDIDEFDGRSHQLGLYLRRGYRETVIGAVRLATNEKQACSSWLEELDGSHMTPGAALRRTPNKPLPCFDYFPGTAAVEELHARMVEADGKGLVEASRLVLRPEFQGARIGLYACLAVAGFCGANGYRSALLTCHSNHANLYRAMGFEIAPGTVPSTSMGIANYFCLLATWSAFPARLKSRIAVMESEWRRTGAITLRGVPRQDTLMNRSVCPRNSQASPANKQPESPHIAAGV